ncbi:glycerophosphodiester phosphodiesterase [Acuticoccus sp. M5D2P5]|uniref:glycerophosphodiester phosphodiesterase family protein n=1 Tax=Acuticoccus kalidii TaxID=2910977 RepID=UPI001F337753|nr:glycerophosphodiester phosphodiesterase family protein [Acuticoccus kalidii]MCF3936162.1 glycerophosphodiester phosphodiesterase [Acuticoccus kalidii]
MIAIVAHRGASATHRENSPAAWRAAVAAGADAVEADVRVTRDGRVVILHDADLLRLAGRPERIDAMNARDLAAISAGDAPAAPSFAAALDAVPPHIPLMLDVKDERPAALKALAAVLPEASTRRIVLAFHEVNSVSGFAGCGHAILAMVPEPAAAPAFLGAGADMVRLWERDAVPARLAPFAERDVPVWMTAGGRGTDRETGDIDPAAIERFAGLGVAGVLLNDPAAACQFIEGAVL